MRKPLVIANWKMNGDSDTNRALLTALLGFLDRAGAAGDCDCVVCPPYPYLEAVRDLLANSGIELGPFS